MEPILGLVGMIFFAYCLRWQWDVPRGTSQEADFDQKKREYEQDTSKEVRTDEDVQIVENSSDLVPSEGKMRISPEMVDRVKINGVWKDVVDASYFEVKY